MERLLLSIWKDIETDFPKKKKCGISIKNEGE